MIWEQKVATVVMLTNLKERKEVFTTQVPLPVGEVIRCTDMEIAAFLKLMLLC